MKFLATFIVVILPLGCVSNTYMGTNERFESSPSEVVVYVTNPEHRNYEILRDSALYIFADNPMSEYKLTLHDSEHRFGCGMGVLLPMFTLGLFQSNTPADELFIYEIEGPNDTKVYQHYLSMEYKTSIWQFFAKPFVGNERKVKTKALKYSKRELYGSSSF